MAPSTRSTSSVDPPPMSRTTRSLVEPSGPPWRRRRRPPPPPHRSGSPRPPRGPGRGRPEEGRALGPLPAALWWRRGPGQLAARHADGVHDPAVLAQHGERPLHRVVAEAPGCVDPRPRLVILISRTSGRPDSSTTSSRVEFVPQSSAATAVMQRAFHDWPLGNELAGSIFGRRRRPTGSRAAGEEVREVGVEALDPDARAPDAAARDGTAAAGGRAPACAVRSRRGSPGARRVHLASIRRTPPPASMPPDLATRGRDRRARPCRHGRPVIHPGRVQDDHRSPSAACATTTAKAAPRHPTEQPR